MQSLCQMTLKLKDLTRVSKTKEINRYSVYREVTYSYRMNTSLIAERILYICHGLFIHINAKLENGFSSHGHIWIFSTR